MRRLNLRLPDEIQALLDTEKSATRRSIQQLVREAITIAYQEQTTPVRFFAPELSNYMPLTEFIGSANDFCFVGATLRTLRELDDNRAFLQEKAEEHASMTFLLLDPHGPEYLNHCLGGVRSLSIQAVVRELEATVGFLREIRLAAGDFGPRVKIRGLRVFPALGLTIVNPGDRETKIRAAFYPMQSIPRFDPFLECDRSSEEGRKACALFEHHYNELLLQSEDISEKPNHGNAPFLND